MKQCRFGLDNTHLDADLCEKITQLANGGSWNDACRLYLRILHYQSGCQNLSPERQTNVTECTDNDSEVSDVEINLSGLDSTFSELGE